MDVLKVNTLDSTRKVPIDFDPSNNACYITVAWIDYCGEIEQLWETCFPNPRVALAFFKPQIYGEWKLMERGGFEADLREDCAMNYDRPGEVRAYRIRITNLLLMAPENCVSPEATIDNLVAEDR